MNNLTVFQYSDKEIRTIVIDDEPWFVAKDVLAAMESKTTVTAVESMVAEGLGDEFVTNQPIKDSLNREQKALFLSEPALTFFLSRSRTEAGKNINRWIHSEVLPSIRKTGSYAIAPQPETIALPPRDTIDYVEAAATLETMPDSTLKALLRDSMVDELCLRRSGGQALLEAPKKQYTIVKVRAKQLGYSLKEIGNGAALGRFVHSRVPIAYQEMVGRYPVYHYEITSEFDTAIHTFFGAK